MIVFISCLNAYGASGDGGDAAAFLKNGVGVRPISMGKAFVAVADDASAGYWNPAGLAKLGNPQLSLMYSNPMNYDVLGSGGVKDIGYHTFSAAFPSHYGSVGLNFAYLSVGDIQVVEDASGPTGKTFQDKEMGVILSYANSITELIRLGLNLKFVQQDLFDQKGSGVGMDIGILYEPMYNLILGLMAQDLITPKITLKDTAYSPPRKVVFGMSYKLLDDRMLLAAGMDKASGRSAKFHLGAEGHPVKDFAIRAGYTSDTGEISAGIGFRISLIQIDYGFGLLSLGSTHRVSLTMTLY
jgi:tetrahydromethanopterin S-methyltransferase subunit G